MAALALKSDRLPIRTPEDVVIVRQHVRRLAQELPLSLVDQTKVVTATSEIARNTLTHGRGGWGCTGRCSMRFASSRAWSRWQ